MGVVDLGVDPQQRVRLGLRPQRHGFEPDRLEPGGADLVEVGDERLDLAGLAGLERLAREAHLRAIGAANFRTPGDLDGLLPAADLDGQGHHAVHNVAIRADALTGSLGLGVEAEDLALGGLDRAVEEFHLGDVVATAEREFVVDPDVHQVATGFVADRLDPEVHEPDLRVADEDRVPGLLIGVRRGRGGHDGEENGNRRRDQKVPAGRRETMQTHGIRTPGPAAWGRERSELATSGGNAEAGRPGVPTENYTTEGP